MLWVSKMGLQSHLSCQRMYRGFPAILEAWRVGLETSPFAPVLRAHSKPMQPAHGTAGALSTQQTPAQTTELPPHHHTTAEEWQPGQVDHVMSSTAQARIRQHLDWQLSELWKMQWILKSTCPLNSNALCQWSILLKSRHSIPRYSIIDKNIFSSRKKRNSGYSKLVKDRHGTLNQKLNSQSRECVYLLQHGYNANLSGCVFVDNVTVTSTLPQRNQAPHRHPFLNRRMRLV